MQSKSLLRQPLSASAGQAQIAVAQAGPKSRVADVGRCSGAFRRLFGLAVLNLDWTGTLAFAERLLSRPYGQTTLAFLDTATLLRQVFDPACRSVLRRRLLLPSAFSGKTFMPALLTFLEDGRRIAVVAEDAEGSRRMQERLGSHAPWHDFVALPAGGTAEAAGRFDIVIIAAGGWAEQRRLEAAAAPLGARLVVMAGRLY